MSGIQDADDSVDNTATVDYNDDEDDFVDDI